LNRSLGNGLLEAAKDSTDIIVAAARMYQQMHMLGHDHVRPEVEIVLVARSFDGVE
jgi:hypothetical protein